MHECRSLADHDFEFYKKNKHDYNELPQYKCTKCGITWEEMQEIGDAQLRLDGVDPDNPSKEYHPETVKAMTAFFQKIAGL